jgi:hypothetical protein
VETEFALSIGIGMDAMLDLHIGAMMLHVMFGFH